MEIGINLFFIMVLFRWLYCLIVNFHFGIRIIAVVRRWKVFTPVPSLGWWEVGAYIGLLPFVLFIFSFKLIKEHWPLILSGVFIFVITLGDFMSFSLWSIIHKFPVFNNMHIPSRAESIFIFFISLIIWFILRGSKKQIEFKRNT